MTIDQPVDGELEMRCDLHKGGVRALGLLSDDPIRLQAFAYGEGWARNRRTGEDMCDDCQFPSRTVPASPEPILTEADRIINGQRRSDYGDAQESFDRIAGMWSAYLGHDVTGLDVVNLMCLLKVARAKHGFHRDSYVDICGYAALSELLERTEA